MGVKYWNILEYSSAPFSEFLVDSTNKIGSMSKGKNIVLTYIVMQLLYQNIVGILLLPKF